jgi:hypothetical protein
MESVSMILNEHQLRAVQIGLHTDVSGCWGPSRHRQNADSRLPRRRSRAPGQDLSGRGSLQRRGG